MHLIVIYIVLVVVGEVAAFAVGRLFEETLPGLSMLFYMGLFFGVLWLAWPLAVVLVDRWMPERDVSTRAGSR
jgi:hypothetical protein